ncbi:PREDICTED: U-box domain-containing protein 51 [Fragaria vesca subsp. vesca]|uniref:U-box domain-containing protein 51 n=1 Tax=Fragaria vesca subsp. vesca TaxID=101020 RepID=UPI0002C2F84A|nr:PREDICTED: U-box domain-containing protein 51 [Fragaria vesca subsp. vesca]
MGNSNSSNSREIITKYKGGTIAVGVSADKTSQNALKWAIDYLVTPPTNDVVLKLIHVAQKSPSPRVSPGNGEAFDRIEEMLLPFRCYCTRKRVPFEIVILEDDDVAEALVDYISCHGIENIIFGTSSRNGFSKRLFKTSDVPSTVQKLAADFCNVFTICKGKIWAVRAARHRLPALPALPAEFTYIGRAASRKSYDEVSLQEPDMDTGLSFVGSERRSTDSMLYAFYENFGQAEFTPISSMSPDVDITVSASELDFGSFDSFNTMHEMPSMAQHNNSGNPFLSQKVLEEMEEEMKSLRMELKQTIEMYHGARNEALKAKQKAAELQEEKMKEEQRLEEALLTLEATVAALKNEQEKCKAAMLAAEASQTLFGEEVQTRVRADKMEENKGFLHYPAPSNDKEMNDIKAF